MLRRHWTLIVLIFAPLVALWRPVFLGVTIGPVDQIQHMAPWNDPAPSQPWDVLQADGILQFLPWRDLVFKSWEKGQLPAWNPYELAGTPLLANSQSGALYPPHILAGIAHRFLSTSFLLALLAWLHLALAGVGTSVLCRRLGGSEVGGLIAGLSFSLSAFMLSWTALPSVIETVAWIPWALVAVTGIVDGGKFWTKVKPAVALALAMGMMALAGHLQFLAYGSMAVVVFAVGRAIAHRPKSPLKTSLTSLGLAIAGLAAGFALAAPQLLPVLEFSQSSHRRNAPTEAGYEAYSESAIHLWELGGAVYPKLNGDPTDTIDLSGQRISAYWPAYVRPGANFAESAIGLGPLVVCLLMCARRKAPYWRELSPLVFVGVMALLLALGTALGRTLYFLMPGWSSTGSPGRASILVVLAGCVAAGVVASQPVEANDRKRRLYAPVAGFLTLTIVVIYFVMFGLTGLHSGIPSLTPETLTTIITAATHSASMQSVLVAVLTAAAIVMWIRSGRQQALWLLAPIALSPFLVIPALVRSGSGSFRSNQLSAGRIAVINERWNLFDIPDAGLPPNLGSLSGLQELGGYDSLLDKGTKAMLDDINGQNSTPPENGNMMFIKSTADIAKLAEAGVTEVWSSRWLPRFGMASTTDPGLYRYEVKGPGLISLAVGTPKLVEESLGCVTVEAEGPGPLTYRDRNLPGWTASVDGHEAAVESGTWKTVQLGPGSHRIQFNYHPPGLKVGLILMILSFATIGIAFILVRRSVPSRTEPSGD